MTRSKAGTDRPRRRYAQRLPPAARREQLLDAAFDVLGRSELHELSMEAVAAQADVGKPVLYTVFRTRAELVAALLERERTCAFQQVQEVLPTDLRELGPAGAYSATVVGFVRLVVENPTRWRLILTVPASAPSEYRDGLRESYGTVLQQAEALAYMGIALDRRLAALDPQLLARSMLTFAEMSGRLAVSDPTTYSVERLTGFAQAALALLTDAPLKP